MNAFELLFKRVLFIQPLRQHRTELAVVLTHAVRHFLSVLAFQLLQLQIMPQCPAINAKMYAV